MTQTPPPDGTPPDGAPEQPTAPEARPTAPADQATAPEAPPEAPLENTDTVPRRAVVLPGHDFDPAEDTGEVPPVDATGLHLRFSAVSDVGRVRKDNQDSGYAGPWLLAVCDGVGGAARGDIASGTTVNQLRRLDERPGSDLLGHVAGGLLRAHDRIAELVDEDPALNGTSTTATVLLFDGVRVAVAHVGDSRAYLLRGGELTQLTKDHTFVQSLIDEGRITPDEARTHPHRNLILKALDGVHETDPDLFTVDLAEGDRILVCSDGACGVLDDDRLAALLADGNPDFAAIELVRASLEAGSTDNVTCVVADVATSPEPDAEPLLVGAAADLPRRPTGLVTGLFRGHRTGDTGEIEPVQVDIPDDIGFAIPSDPIDPEAARYAPRAPRPLSWLRGLFVIVAVVGLLAAALGAAYAWTQRQYFVGVDDQGAVTIFRGVDYELAGLSLNQPYRVSDISRDQLGDLGSSLESNSRPAESLQEAERIVANLAERAARDEPDADEPGADEAPTDDAPTDAPSSAPADDPADEPSTAPAALTGSAR